MLIVQTSQCKLRKKDIEDTSYISSNNDHYNMYDMKVKITLLLREKIYV